MKKLVGFVLAGALALGLAGCSSRNSGSSSESGELIPIKVGASPAPHAQILEQCVEPLKELGYDLQITEFTDYVMPNTAVEDGSLDANYFAHQPYQDNFNKENGTHIVSVAAIHFEPLGLYPGKTASIDQIQDGAVIAVPNDETNEARALLLLEKEGLIKLKDGVGLAATTLDIEENPHNIEFYEVEAAQTVNVLADVDFAVVNGNYALDAGLSLDNALAIEEADSLAAKTYANIIAVREGDEDSAKTQVIMKILTSDEAKQYIEDTFKGAVLPVASEDK